MEDEYTSPPRTKENYPSDFPDSRITKVYIWDNDMCMVFDQYGHQMPYYQGPIDEVRDLIRADAPPSAIFQGAEWRVPGSAHIIGF